jgi:hypothetical protein
MALRAGGEVGPPGGGWRYSIRKRDHSGQGSIRVSFLHSSGELKEGKRDLDAITLGTVKGG